jgi:uncharacterized protein
VRFRDEKELDPSQVEDVRGRGRVPGGKVAIGGGGLGIVGVIIRSCSCSLGAEAG